MNENLNPAVPRIKGADISSLIEVEEAGGRFFDKATGTSANSAESPVGSRCVSRTAMPGATSHAFGRLGQQATGADEGTSRQEDLLAILKRHGVNLIRLRLWNDPYSEAGKPYGAGTNDLARTMELARRCKALGLPWLLDFHYSDFWADPGKQYPPKAWTELDSDGLARAVYYFTRDTLETLKDEGILPSMVAVGNEISNGLLWPQGRVPNWVNIARFVSAGIRAVKSVSPAIQTMIHLDNGGWYGMCRSWFDSYRINGGASFDWIGLSYYPFWHGSLEELRNNMHRLARTIGKPILVTETSMAFTLEPCHAREGLSPEETKGLAANEKTAEKVPYPMSPEGQCAFLKDLWEVVRSVPNGLGRGFVWWEPAWLPVKGSGWTTPEGLAYVREKGPGGNEWANQGWFDYDGKALPALKTLEEL